MPRCYRTIHLLAVGLIAGTVLSSAAKAASDFWVSAIPEYFESDIAWLDESRPTEFDSANFNQLGTFEVLFDEVTFAMYGGEPTINDLFLTGGNVRFYTASGPTRTLSMNGTNGSHSIDISTGTMTVGDSIGALNMEAESILWVNNNGTLNIGSGSRVDIGLLTVVRTGGSINIGSGGNLVSPGGINLGTDGNGSITVDGTGSTVETNDLSLWGGGGGTANATFSNSALGTFVGGLSLVSNANPGSTATVNVLSGADLSITGALALGQFGGTGNVATLNIHGTGSTVGLAGASTLVVGHSSTGTATINIGTAASGGLLSTGMGTTTVATTGTINIGSGTTTGSLLASGNISVNGGVLQRGSLGSLILAPGTSLTVLSGGRATFTGNLNTTNNIYTVSGTNSKLETTTFLQIGNGATVNVTLAGLVSAPSYIDIGTAGNGTLTASGTGSQISGGNTTSFWGDSGHVAAVSLSSNALATFSTGIEMARSSTAGTAATVDVQSGADLNVGALRMAAAGGATTLAILNVQGSGSTVTQGGTTFLIGHSSTGTAAVNIGTTVSQAVFTTNATQTTINKTGTVTVGSASTIGTFNVNGNITISGGILQRSVSSSFTLQTGRTMTVNSGGRATFTGSYTTANATYNVSGMDSRMETTAFMDIRNGATVNVSDKATLSVGSYLDIGPSGTGTLNVDGLGTTVLSPGSMWWGSGGGTANVYLTNDAVGVFSSIQMARTATAGTTSNVNVLSGSDMTVGQLSIAADGGATTTGTLNVQSSGSTVTQTSSNSLNIGHATTGTATVNIGTTSSGAIFSTGTGAVTINRRGTVNVGGDSSTGTFNINGNASVNGVIDVAAGSAVNVAAGKTLTFTSGGTLPNDGALRGGGLITGAVFNDGVVQPGDSIGALTIDGNYTQQSSGTLQMEIGSPMSYDRLVVSQHATLEQQILIQLVGGFTPTAGDSFDLIDWNTVSGSFDVFQYPGLPDGLDWDFREISTTGVVRVVKPGDFNADGIVDTADYVVWRKGLGTTYTQSDYNIWMANFGETAGAGSADSSRAPAVPEPSSLLLVMVCGLVCGGTMPRRRAL